ncbi:MAG: winged helix-turn-helix domain-containing protein [Candidatus Hodarchaeales archaeon]|jgi:DNA-binding transcriptional ArsR family regulator
MDDRRKILYNFWESLPALKIITSSKEEIFGHKLRLVIIRLLREGVLEINEDIKQKQRRRALSAREIQKTLLEEESEFKDLSLQSLYFHLQKLEEAGLIQTITILREGRHNIAFYGRTARIFLFGDFAKEQKEYSRAFHEITRFAKSKNPDVKDEEIDIFLNRFLEYEKKRKQRISDWLIQHESIIAENNIDLSYLYKFIELVDSINPEYIKIFKELLEILILESIP